MLLGQGTLSVDATHDQRSILYEPCVRGRDGTGGESYLGSQPPQIPVGSMASGMRYKVAGFTPY